MHATEFHFEFIAGARYPSALSRIRLGWSQVWGRQIVAESRETFTKAQELRSFLFLSVVMAPVLAVVFVSGYGFIVWMYQLVAGPPGS
jgi:nitrate reductase NapE